MQGGGDAEHVPGAVGEVSLAIRMDFEFCRNPRERICHTDGQCLWFEEEGVAVVQFLEKFAGFFGGDIKVRDGFVHAGRVGSVCEVVVDKVSDLPENIFVFHLSSFILAISTFYFPLSK